MYIQVTNIEVFSWKNVWLCMWFWCSNCRLVERKEEEKTKMETFGRRNF